MVQWHKERLIIKATSSEMDEEYVVNCSQFTRKSIFPSSHPLLRVRNETECKIIILNARGSEKTSI